MMFFPKKLLFSGLFMVLSAFLFIPPTLARDVPELKKLVHGLQWSPGWNSPDLKPPRVQKTAVPPLRVKGVKTFGVAYEIKMEAQAPQYPLHLSFPLPAAAMAAADCIVFIKLSGGKEEVLFPTTVDKKNARATLLVRSFSTIVIGAWDGKHHQVRIEGAMMMTEKAEEEPQRIYFDMTCSQTSSGEYANFVQAVDGLGKWDFFMPLPSTHFGSYVFQRIIGFTSNFIFAGDPLVSSPLHIDGSKSVYGVSLNVIPVTTRMEGLVVDGEGSSLDGVRIAVAGPYNVTYRTRSRNGGRYLIDYLGMTDSRIAMTESMVCTLTNPEDNKCPPVKLTLRLTAGQTYREDLVYHPQGEIRGYIRDKWGNELEKATVEITPSRDGPIIREVSSPYRIEQIPIGEATVTVICPAQLHRQTKRVDIACPVPGFSEEYTNFELDCSGTIHGYVRDKWKNDLDEVTIEIRPAQGEKITRIINSPFGVDDIPVGEARVTVICPSTLHRQTRTVSIGCEAPGSKGNEIDVQLECSGEIRGTIRDTNGNLLQEATLEIKPTRGTLLSRKVGGHFHVEALPIGQATVTAVCDEGQGRQSKQVRIACGESGPDQAKVDFVLDCQSGMVFDFQHSGSMESQGHLYNITSTTRAGFSLVLPKGKSEAEVEVTYPVEHVLEANAVGPPRHVSISPSSYTLNAKVRWRVEKHEKSNGVNEYVFSAEIVHAETRAIHVVHDSGSGMDPIMNLDFAGVPALIDQTAGTLGFSVRRGGEVDEFPFNRTEDHSDRMPQGLIGPQGRFGSSSNRYKSTMRVEISGEGQGR